MAVVIDSPKPAKQEEFVEKQINQARQRIRQLDYFSSGAILLIAALVFTLAYLIVDRYVETPRWTLSALVGFYLFSAAGFLYISLFRLSRRAINPYYAAKQVEDSLTGAKNSVVNWVDLKDDEKIPNSVRSALGTRAAKDLKNVDLNQVIQKKDLLWLAGIAGVLFVSSLVVAFLPPTRTQLTLLSPKDGNTTVTQGEDAKIEIELKGRIPAKGQPDAARIRLWTNPEDPGDFEERPLEPSEDNKRLWKITIPAKQIRSGGFYYKVLAGKVETPDYQVGLRIRPEFAGFVVNYAPPAWSKHAPETTNDPNIVGFYGSIITLTAQINKPVKSGHLEVDGQVELIPGEVVEDASDSLKFTFKLEKNTTYRIRFVTAENEKNTDARTYSMKVLDALPRFSEYEVSFNYPKYLRFKDERITVREPHLDAMRGTQVDIVGFANRPLKSAQLTIAGQPPLPGELNKDEPTQVKFSLPPLMTDGSYTISFVPDTGEKESISPSFTIKVNQDQKPTASIVKPLDDIVELPVNGTLHVEGSAKDDIGVAKVTLRMEVVEGGKQPLAPKPYRDGKSLQSLTDGSYPTQLEYQDIIDLTKVKPLGEAGAGFQLRPGMVIEYWLDVEDNCTVGGPNSGSSDKKKIKLVPAPQAPEKKQQQEQQNKQAQKEQKEHEQKQDEKLKNEKRDPNQKPKQSDQPKNEDRGQADPKGGQPEPKKGQSDPANPQKGDGQNAQPQPRQNSPEDENVEKTAEELKNKLPPDPKMPDQQNPKPNDPKTQPMGETNPSPEDPKTQPMGDPNPKQDPKQQPKNGDPKTEPMGESNPNQSPKPEDMKNLAKQLQSSDPKQREEAQKKLEEAMKKLDENPEAKKEAEKKLDEARKEMTPEQKKDFDDARKKAQENVDKQKQQDEQQKKQNAKEQLEQAKELAKKLESKDENERKEAQDQVKKMVQEQSKTKNDSEDAKQDDIKKHLSETERKELAKAREKINDEMQKEVQKQKEQQAQQELNDLKDLNKKLQSKDAGERKQAQEKLDKMMEDQAKADPEESEKHAQETRDNLNNDEQKKEFDQAQQNLQNAKRKRQQQKRQDDAEDHLHRLQQTAKNLDSPDENERKQAEEDIERLTREKNQGAGQPKKEDENQKEEELRKNLPNDQQRKEYDDAKDKIDQAVKKKTKQQKEQQAQQQLDGMKNLAKDLESKEPGVQKAAQKQLEKMRREQAKSDPKDAQKQMNEVRDNLKDEKQKNDFDQLQNKLAQEMQKQEEAQRPKPEDIEQAAKQLAQSGNSEQKQKAQEKLEDWMKDPKNKDQVEKGLEDAKQKMTPQQQKNIDNAVEQAKKPGKEEAQPGKEDGQAAQKVAEQAKNLANKLNSSDPKEKKQAEQNLEKAMQQAAKDPKQKADAQKELDKVRNELPKDKQAEFDKSLDQIAQHMKNSQPDEKSAPSSGELKKTADELAKKGSSAEKKEAQQKLEDWMRDPKNKQQVEKELSKLAQDMKDPQQKKNLEQAIEDAKKQVAKNPTEPKADHPPKLDPKEVEKLAKELQANGNGKAKQDAMKKLENGLKDPKQQGKIQKQLDEMSKNLSDEAAKKNLQDALKEIAKNIQNPDPKNPKLPSADEVEKLAKQLETMDENSKEAAKKKLEEMMKDPSVRGKIQKQLEDFKNKIKDDRSQQEFARQISDLADRLARIDRETQPTKGPKENDVAPVAELKNKLHAGELLLEKFKREISNEEFQKQSKMTPEQLAEFQKKYEAYLSRLRQDLDRMEKQAIQRGSGASPLNNTTNEKIDERNTGSDQRGGKYTAPPGFADPYKKFTEDISGVKSPPKN